MGQAGMDNRGRSAVARIKARAKSRAIAWALVIGGHVLLLVFMSNSTRARREPARDDSEPLMVLFLDLPQPEEEQPIQEPKFADPKLFRPRAEPTIASDSDTAITLPAGGEDQQPEKPNVDWYKEAEQVAKEHTDELVAANKRTCDPNQSDRPGSLLPKCKKNTVQHEWNPKEARVGVQGLIPYVRLGKRCVVGLGFFGCALGKLPEADGHVFDDMRDPDRPQSSVPDIPGKDY